MCHDFLCASSFYQQLYQMDQAMAAEVQVAGCRFCAGVLHSACYPRKPRGLREAWDASYNTRLSFCCAQDGCRRRHTPPSVRFLGRKVYLGTMVVLLTALHHGLTERRRRELIERLNVPSQTLSRWRHWWRETFAISRRWRAQQGQFMPPVTGELPAALLGRLIGASLVERLCQLLRLIWPITTSWSGSLQEGLHPQKM